MHHQDFAGDSAGTGGRKMSHPSGFHHRRGSGGTSAPSSAAAVVLTGEESAPQAGSGSSSPGLHHQLQSQAAGAQMKKKSGFQITSVTSAQINVSASNSLADDTESYDDMDESHTEDLSSSDMLDVSVSRATDTGVPERSSSDETLNSLHGVDTPGLASPNEPLPPQGPQTSMVNGGLHHQPPAPTPHPHAQQVERSDAATPSGAASTSGSQAVTPNPRAGKPHRVAVLNTPGTVAGTTALHPAAGVGGSCAESRTPTPLVNSGPVCGAAGATPSGPAGPHRASVVQPAAPNGQIQTLTQTQTQAPAPTGSRFRVVKLDTNSEPFRKGRWTCTEYYEKEVPPAQASETPRASEAPAADLDGGTGPGPQPPQTLQPPQQGVQDFTSPSAMQSPPLPLHAQVPLQALSRGLSLLQQPAPVLHPHMSYQATLQPDFIQPTAPFQTQVQPPPPSHVTPGVAMVTGHGGGTLAPVGLAQQPPHPGLPAAVYTAGQPQRLPAQSPAPYIPLTTLHADLQPLLAPGATFAHTSTLGAVPGGGAVPRMSHLEDAQRLLLQHQLEQQAAGMAAEAAGLRGQQTEGDDDSSSGASVVAIDNKIEQAMDLVKSHLMYAVREEVEVLKEQIKELIEKNSQLEQENTLLKTLASPEQMAQFHAQVQTDGSPTAPPASLAPPPAPLAPQAGGAGASPVPSA